MKQSNWIEKGVWGLLIVLNALFLYYWVVLAANYCMHFDDVHFMWKLRECSIFEYVREMYMTRGGNFVSYGLNGVMFTISNWLGAYRFWTLLFYSLGIFMTWSVFRETPLMGNSGWKGLLGVVTLYNVYVLTSIDYAVFTWMCAMEYYLFAPALCMLIKYLVKDSLNWKQWILIIVLAIFISGNAVSISTVTFVVLFAYGMYMWYRVEWNIRDVWTKPQVRRLFMITILMLVCFAMVFVAPGNWSRMNDEFDIEQPKNLMEFGKAIIVCAGMFMYLMAFYLPYHLIAVALGACVGYKHPMALPLERNKAVLWTLLIAVAYLVVCVVPLAYLSNGFQIQRNYTQIGFFYILTFFLLGYVWTSGTKRKEVAGKCAFVCTYVCAIFLITIMALNIHQDIPVARAYNIAHQEREIYLQSLQEAGNKDMVVVEKYPSTHTPDAKYFVLKLIGKKAPMQAIYYESDVDVEPNSYEASIRKIYGLDFDFILAEPKE